MKEKTWHKLLWQDKYYKIHSRILHTFWDKQKKNISFRKKSFSNQSKRKILENSRKNIKIVIKILSRKDRESNNLFRKGYKLNQSDQVVFSKNESSSKKMSRNSKFKIDVFTLNIAMIKAFAFNMMSKQKNVYLFSITLKNVKKHLEKASRSNIVSKNLLLMKYHDFLNVFDKKTFNILVSHKSYDHKIVLEKNAVLDYTSLYNMLEKKLKIVKKYLEDNSKKKFITISKSSFVFSIMFMKKTNKSLRFCVDYKKLNQLTKRTNTRYH